jgi:HEAT repeat protein
MLPLAAPALRVFPLAWLLVAFLLAGLPALAAAEPRTPRPARQTETATGPAAREALAGFASGDPGWQVRMKALVALARVGPAAVPVLIDALKKGSPSTRELAAQALVFCTDSRAQQALEDALDDPEISVRLYACAARSMLGRLEPAKHYLRLRDRDYWAVRQNMAFALARDDKPDPAALRKALANYDLAAMDSARVGGLGPDFTLGDLQGKTHRLSDFRGKKGVFLIFLGIA